MTARQFARRKGFAGLMAAGLWLSSVSAYANDSGFTGFSVYSGTGYQNATVKASDLRVKNTDIRLPSTTERTDSSFWFTGLDYTQVFSNNVSLGTQFQYYPVSGQVAISISPGYAFNETVLGYVKLGWAYVPTTVNQGPGQSSYKTNLNAVYGGVGIRATIYRGLYGYAEMTYAQVERLTFNSFIGTVPVTGHADTQAFNAIIGLGYRF